MSKKSQEIENNSRYIQRFSSSHSYLNEFFSAGNVILDEEGQIVELSGSALKNLENVRDFKEKKSFLLCIHDDEREFFSALLKYFFKTGRTQSCEIRLLTEKESAFYAQLECFVCENREEKNLCKVLLNKITSHNSIFELLKEQTENRKEQSEKKIKLQAMAELSNVIGHELRNSLCAISNSVYYLNMKLKQADNKVKKHLSIIQDEVSHSDQILSEILDFSRSRRLTLLDGDVNSVILDLLKTLTIPNGIIVTTDFADERNTALIDPDQFKKAVLNFIVNAFQAMPFGGILDISTKKISKSLMDISLKDTGEGIADDQKKKIFAPLFTTLLKALVWG